MTRCNALKAYFGDNEANCPTSLPCALPDAAKRAKKSGPRQFVGRFLNSALSPLFARAYLLAISAAFHLATPAAVLAACHFRSAPFPKRIRKPVGCCLPVLPKEFHRHFEQCRPEASDYRSTCLPASGSASASRRWPAASSWQEYRPSSLQELRHPAASFRPRRFPSTGRRSGDVGIPVPPFAFA